MQGDYIFYKLKKDIPCIKAGAIFYWDEEDSIYGSSMMGCLKLCWTPDGNCYDGLCGGTVIFHAKAMDETEWFEKIEKIYPEEMTVQDIEEKLGFKIKIVS